MRRIALLFGVLVALSAAAVASAHEIALFDHPVPSRSTTAPPSPVINAGGQGAEWELVNTIPTGNPHSDLDFFTVKGDTYASVGTLGVGPNSGGQNIVRLTENGAVKPSYIAGHPSAACASAFTSATTLQHDVEAVPKGDAFLQQPNPFIARGDAQLLIDSSDGGGRCHDNGTFGAQNAPNGGLEIIDITTVTAPKEIGLISHIGNAHTVNTDPKRPHIAFDVTQDGVSVGANGVRSNETEGSTSNALDGFEIIDLSSCMNFPAGTTIEQKRKACRPQVYRYRYPEARMATSHLYPNNLQSCHEVEIYPDDRLACASITATLLFDMKGAFDDNGTPNNYLDDKPRGKPLPCKVRESSSQNTPPGLKTGAPVTDCVNGEVNGKAQPLRVSEWKKIGSPSLEGVKWLGTVPHMGFDTTQNIVLGEFDAPRDLVAAHESEISNSGKYVITSDERGGGIVPGGASCSTSPGPDYAKGNGGLHFFPVANFTTKTPLKTAEAHALWANQKNGQPAVYRAPIRTQPQATICTAHVFQQIPGQNRIFMGYYSQGTQVMDFTENEDGTVTFKDAGYFIPANANTWVSHIFKAQRNADGTFTYWGATGDGILPGSGRGAIDVYKVTLPAPPTPAGPKAPGTPEFPLSRIRGVENTNGPAPSCTGTAAFERTDVRPRGRSLSFSYDNRTRNPVSVDLFRESVGRRIGQARVGQARPGSKTFRFTRKVTNGHYFARFSTRAANGGLDVRRVALLRRNGRWTVRAPFYRREACALAWATKLSKSVFGGSRNTPLGISFLLGQNAEVSVEVRQGAKVIQRFPKRAYPHSRTIRLRTTGRKAKRGEVQVVIRAERPGRTQTVTLTSRKL